VRPAVLVVFIDAMGPNQAPLLLEAGLDLPEVTSVRGILGYSSGAIPTILTGAPPSKHGRMCLFSRLEEDDTPPLAPLPPPLFSTIFFCRQPSALSQAQPWPDSIPRHCFFSKFFSKAALPWEYPWPELWDCLPFFSLA